MGLALCKHLLLHLISEGGERSVPGLRRVKALSTGVPAVWEQGNQGPAGRAAAELTWKLFQEKLSRAFWMLTRYVGEIHQVFLESGHFLSQNLADFLVRHPEGLGWH